ncbi:MAG TPA: hypothetical protein VED85_07490, partial [Burkholderiaceae bacterium]|nr:hypothetical protein [Burkholderiaceae bacterium]
LLSGCHSIVRSCTAAAHAESATAFVWCAGAKTRSSPRLAVRAGHAESAPMAPMLLLAYFLRQASRYSI